MADPEKRTLVNGKPPEEVTDETADSQGDDGSGDVHGEGGSPVSDEQVGAAGAGPENDQDGQDEKIDPPGSSGEIKQQISDRFERLKKEGPAPVREAAKGLIDNFFDAIDRGFELWAGRKK